MTLYFANHDITIYRKRRKGSSDRYALSATLTAYRADIQPSSTVRQATTTGRYTAVYDAYVEASVDIKEGDRIRTTDGKKYFVMGVAHYEGAGLLDHTQLTLTSKDA